ncbi:MAG: DsbA family protein [bacterium]
MSARLVYIHDPMCSWCWAFARAYRRLLEALPPSVRVERLLGGLAPDSIDAMSAAMQQHLQRTWRTIEARVPGTRFNHDFWRRCQPRRSTWPACRAVIAARQQGLEHDATMTAAIQRGYYLDAENPSDDATLIAFADALGLDADAFADALNAAATQQQLEHEMTAARQLGVRGFPALMLLREDAAHPPIPIAPHYTDPSAMIARIQSALG